MSKTTLEEKKSNSNITKVFIIQYDKGVTANWNDGKFYLTHSEAKNKLKEDGFTKTSLGWYIKKSGTKYDKDYRAFITTLHLG